MSWSKEDREGPRGYHHGNLKEALLRAALELIAQKGPAGFTFAEAARWAGVSPAAPYRHFRDREELLGSIALRGFQQFETALAKAWDDGRPTSSPPSTGSERPICNSREPSPPTIRRCSKPAFRLLPARNCAMPAIAPSRSCARRRKSYAAQVPTKSRPPALMVALHIWAMAHGVASLFGRGDAARRTLPMSPEELLEAEALIYLRGLGIAEASGASPPIAGLHEVASYLTAARRDVNVIYIHKGGPVMVLVEKLDELGKPAWIALMILGFIVWWPLGLVTLAFIFGSGRMAMGCWGHHNDGSRWQHNMSRWQSKMERMQEKMDRLRGRMEQRGPSGPAWWGGEPRSSGNRAFDDYRTETLQRLEEEQREFKEFLERLRFAKDRAEFDQFMAERRNRPHDEAPQAQPSS